MKITFHGAAQTVTGSQHLLEVNGYRILLECGLFQGRRQESYERNRSFPFNPRQLDAVILSHAHIDHSGNLPHLVKAGYHGRIYTTHATAHLANLMLLDSGNIHESDAEFVNKHRIRKGEPPIEPLYTVEDAAHVAQFFEVRDYEQPFEVVPGITGQLVDAGHILGSAAVVLDISENGRRYRLWFSGDIGRRNLPLLRDPILPSEADYLIMECTYGDTVHKPPEASYEELRIILKNATAQRGKVIIPAFAVGRTQELVYDIHQMIDKGEIAKIPVYIDSPLAVNASEIFSAHLEYFDQETHDFLNHDIHHSVLGQGLVTYVRSVEQSKALNHMPGPMVIISASGMAESGRVLHHLANNIEDPHATILIVSWQAPYTLGRRLADQERKVKIYGEEYTRRAEVMTIEGFSSHAGQPFLVEYAKACQGRMKQIFLVHGEAEPAQAFTEKLVETGISNVSFPELHTAVEI